MSRGVPVHLNGNIGKNISFKKIPGGRAGVRATLDEMRKMVKQYKTSLPVRETAGTLTQHLAQKNFLGEVRTLHRYVRDHIRYLRDIHGVETLQTPERTLAYGYGDCDDKSTLLAALLESIGHPTRFIAVGKTLDSFNHVYVETLAGRSNWIPLDTTEPVEAGWSPPNMNSRMVVHN